METPTIKVIKGKAEPIFAKHRITKAGVFGSIAKGKATSNSDVDILIELGEKISLLEFVAIKLELEDLLGMKVDLVEYQAIKPRLKKRILGEEVRIYG